MHIRHRLAKPGPSSKARDVRGFYGSSFVGTTAAAPMLDERQTAVVGIPSAAFRVLPPKWFDLLKFRPGIGKVGICKGGSSRKPANNKSGHVLHSFRQVVQKLSAAGDIVVSAQEILQQRYRSSVAPDETAPVEERPEELNPIAQVLESDPELVTLFVGQFRQLLATLLHPPAKPVEGTFRKFARRSG